MTPRWGLAAVVCVAAVWSGAGTAGASPSPPGAVSVSFTAAAAAPVMQVTEDEPTATFHPEGEGEYGYTLVTADPSAASALAALAWPGSAAGNAGTLVAVLGGPDVSALNDPVQASAASGTGQTHSSVTAPSGSTMTASVEPTGPADQHAAAATSLAGGGLGAAGQVGSSTSSSTIDFDVATAVLSVVAHSHAADIDVGGVVHVGSVTSAATARARDGGAPTLSGLTAFHQMTIAGQPAYVDGSGVHLGSQSEPAGPAVVASVDSALAAAGMEIYFTAPHTVTVGGTAYYYAASVLFYWAPPGDTSHNSFTMALGGSAVSLTDSPQPDSFTASGGDLTGPGGAAVTGPGSAAPPPGPSSPVSRPTPSVSAATGPDSLPAGATLSLPAPPSAAVAPVPARSPGAALSAVQLPGGVGAGWWVLAVLAAAAGAAITTRVPALLQRQAVTACPRARPPRPPSTRQEERR